LGEFPFARVREADIFMATLIECEAPLEPSERLSTNIQNELARRHKAAALTVHCLLALTVVLALGAFMGKNHFRQRDDPYLYGAWKIVILVFGLGSIVLRRTRFSTMRLQDITALEGVSGLLATLEKTTLQIALFSGAIAIFGFVVTLATGNDYSTYGACLVSFVVLIYCYPTRSSWQRTVDQFAPAAETAAPPAVAPDE
jgi:hypothetical protein